MHFVNSMGEGFFIFIFIFIIVLHPLSSLFVDIVEDEGGGGEGCTHKARRSMDE